MKVPIETIRLSQKARDQLSQLKRKTGIENWNVLCRWAFCMSISEDSEPAPAEIPSDSSVEMNWKTFGGEFEQVYRVLFYQRSATSGSSGSEYFRLHLHRGIGYLQNALTNDKKDGLIAMIRITEGLTL